MTQLVQAIHGLEQREQLVLTLYYYEKLTFKEIGHVLDLTESRVCQLHSRAITLLRANLQQEVPMAVNKPARKVERTYSSNKSQPVVDRKG
jgi:DNA-directed RNA polymerase specialized sigma24 family protein